MKTFSYIAGNIFVALGFNALYMFAERPHNHEWIMLLPLTSVFVLVYVAALFGVHRMVFRDSSAYMLLSVYNVMILSGFYMITGTSYNIQLMWQLNMFGSPHVVSTPVVAAGPYAAILGAGILLYGVIATIHKKYRVKERFAYTYVVMNLLAALSLNMLYVWSWGGYGMVLVTQMFVTSIFVSIYLTILSWVHYMIFRERDAHMLLTGYNLVVVFSAFICASMYDVMGIWEAHFDRFPYVFLPPDQYLFALAGVVILYGGIAGIYRKYQDAKQLA